MNLKMTCRVSLNLACGALLLSSCTAKNKNSDEVSTPETVVQDAVQKAVQKGKNIYQSQCISCHNSDPSKVGAIGPKLAGSSLELLEKKLFLGVYPDGYQPQRKTGQMPLFPHLKSDIRALHEYLNSVRPN